MKTQYKFPIASLFFLVYGMLFIYGQYSWFRKLSLPPKEVKEGFYFNVFFAGMVILLGVLLIVFKNSYALLVPTIGMSVMQLVRITKVIISYRFIFMDGAGYFGWRDAVLLLSIVFMLTGHFLLVAVIIIGKIESLEILMKLTWWCVPIIYLIVKFLDAINFCGIVGAEHFLRAIFIYDGIFYLFIAGTFFMGLFLAHPYKKDSE